MWIALTGAVRSVLTFRLQSKEKEMNINYDVFNESEYSWKKIDMRGKK
jgi:hypothetical protein